MIHTIWTSKNILVLKKVIPIKKPPILSKPNMKTYVEMSKVPWSRFWKLIWVNIFGITVLNTYNGSQNCLYVHIPDQNNCWVHNVRCKSISFSFIWRGGEDNLVKFLLFLTFSIDTRTPFTYKLFTMALWKDVFSHYHSIFWEINVCMNENHSRTIQERHIAKAVLGTIILTINRLLSNIQFSRQFFVI